METLRKIGAGKNPAQCGGPGGSTGVEEPKERSTLKSAPHLSAGGARVGRLATAAFRMLFQCSTRPNCNKIAGVFYLISLSSFQGNWLQTIYSAGMAASLRCTKIEGVKSHQNLNGPAVKPSPLPPQTPRSWGGKGLGEGGEPGRVFNKGCAKQICLAFFS